VADLKVLHVACAIIEKDGMVLVARRSKSMSMPLKWEFPGGKLHEGESLEECLIREVMEELGIGIKILKPLTPNRHSYDEFDVTLYPFVCLKSAGDIRLVEHAEAVWLKPDQLAGLDWAEADIPVVQEYLCMKLCSLPRSAESGC
jgi:8-oxo-dGTP diphosphatase